MILKFDIAILDLLFAITCYNAPYVIASKSLHHSRRAIQGKFDPASTITAYNARSDCGPRGQNAGADIRQRFCPHGAVVVKEDTGRITDKPVSEWNTVAIIDGCEYVYYRVYECLSETESMKYPFDPSSTLAQYTDRGICGPRGNGAQADLSQCIYGGTVVKEVNGSIPGAHWNQWDIVTTINGCGYLRYWIFECRDSAAGGGGDPHFSAFGGISFSWQGHCDSILAMIPGQKNAKSGLEIQIRTKKVRHWSTIDVVAVKVGRHVLEIGSNEGKLLLNGNEVESVNKDSLIVSSTRIKERIILYKFVFDEDKNLEVKVNTRSEMIFVSLSGNYPKDTFGLLGSPHRPGLFARGGSDMIDEDINAFVESWQVRDDDTQLFQTTREPQFPAKCLYNMVDKKGKTRSRRLKEIHEITAEEANAACDIHSRGPLKTFCVEDMIATGDFESAQDEFYG